MGWRERLPRLRMGWTWVRHDVVRDQVLLHHPHGLWAWVPVPDARRELVDHPQALDGGLRMAVRDRLRGECALYFEVWGQCPRFWLERLGPPLERVRGAVDHQIDSMRYMAEGLQRMLVETCASCEGTGWTALGQCPDCRHARNDLAYLQRTAP